MLNFFARRLNKRTIWAYIDAMDLLIALLIVLVVASALAVIATKHLSRKKHAELYQLQRQRDELHVAWTKLLLEQSSLAAQPRVESIAQSELNMFLPEGETIQLVRH